jgi:hypothetical protein
MTTRSASDWAGVVMMGSFSSLAPVARDQALVGFLVPVNP